MTVGEFGWETDVVAHHRVQGSFVFAESGFRREDDVETGMAQEGVPEWIFFIHIEDAGNAYCLAALPCVACGRVCLCRPVEEQLVLVGVDVLTLHVVLALVVEHSLALVAREVLDSPGEGVAGHIAVILATMALQLLRVVMGEAQEIVDVPDGFCGFRSYVIRRGV